MWSLHDRSQTQLTTCNFYYWNILNECMRGKCINIKCNIFHDDWKVKHFPLFHSSVHSFHPLFTKIRICINILSLIATRILILHKYKIIPPWSKRCLIVQSTMWKHSHFSPSEKRNWPFENRRKEGKKRKHRTIKCRRFIRENSANFQFSSGGSNSRNGNGGLKFSR